MLKSEISSERVISPPVHPWASPGPPSCLLQGVHRSTYRQTVVGCTRSSADPVRQFINETPGT